MTWLLFSLTAYGQEGVANYDTSGDWRDCQNHSPIAGTAGFANAQSANATNALAYGATAFMQTDVAPMLQAVTEEGDGKWHGAGAYVYRVTAGAAHVPTKELGYPFGGCPSSLRISSRPLDLGSVQLGGAASNGRYGVFYSAALTYGITPSEDVRERLLFHGSGMLYGSVGALLAPLSGEDQSFSSGASAVQADFVIGGLAEVPGVLHARAGWVGSQGLYTDIQGDFPLFLSAVVDNPSISNLLSGGLRRLSTPLGNASVFVKNQPFRPLPDLNRQTGLPQGEPAPRGVNLTTGTLEQQDIADHVDLAFSYAVSPTPLIHQARVGYHSPGFWDPSQASGSSFLAQAGMVQLPDLWFYGVEGGVRPTLRVEVGSQMMHMVLLYNDPEQLVLFPYAYNALTLGLRVDFSG